MAIFVDSKTYLVYAAEVTYGTAPGTINTFLGKNTSNTLEWDNNLMEGRGINCGRGITDLQAGGFDPSVATSFDLVKGGFLEYALGAVSGAGTAGDPYLYVLDNDLPSMTIQGGYKFSGTTKLLNFVGCYNNTTKISLRKDAVVKVDMTFMGYTVALADTAQTLTCDALSKYVFTGGSIEAPTSTTLTEIEGGDIEISNGLIRDRDCDGRLNAPVPGPRTIKISIDQKCIDTFWMTQSLGGAAGPSTGTPAVLATLKFNLTNGSKSIEIEAQVAIPGKWTSRNDLGALAKQNVTLIAKTISASEVDS